MALLVSISLFYLHITAENVNLDYQGRVVAMCSEQFEKEREMKAQLPTATA